MSPWDYLRQNLKGLNADCVIVIDDEKGSVIVVYEPWPGYVIEGDEILEILKDCVPLGIGYSIQCASDLILNKTKSIDKICIQCNIATASCGNKCNYCSKGRIG